MTATEGLIHEQIAAQAAARPSAIAVVAGDERLTYGELVSRAMGVGRMLRAVGAGPDRVVALDGARSLDGVVGMLGILSAGAAYLYLDQALPQERRQHMLEECRAVAILATDRMAPSRLRGQAIPIHQAEPVSGWEVLGDDVPRSDAGPRDLAYVVYTSGSTGLPKGVAIEHGGVVNTARGLASAFQVGTETRFLQFSSWSWDAAVAEILMPLAAGGTVVLAPDAVRDAGEDLADFLRASGVSVVTLTPSVLAATPSGDLPDLRSVVAVGEACPPELVRRWSAPGRRFLNGYGPTEATVAVSVGECHPEDDVHIGEPLPGVRVQVVDESGRPVEPGEPGELLVGGAGLARGYMGELDPETHSAPPAAREHSGGAFFADGEEARWYRTGDRVTQRGDGILIHMGRLDDQVKLHGYRIEVGEIEHTLRRNPAVRDCAVAVRGGRLVADVVADVPLERADLVAKAREWLPPHMIPNVRVVEQLPRTRAGKLDRAAVAAAANIVPERRARRDGADPDGMLAVVLAAVRELLETEAIGPEDNLFDFGGHSLLAAELSVTLSGRLGIDLPALTVIENPTPAQLAQAIRVSPLERAAV